MNTSERLKDIRKKLSLKQEEMAKRLGIKQSYYSALERGVKPIGSNIIEILVKEFDVNAEWFYSSNGTIFNSNKNLDNAKFTHSGNNSKENTTLQKLSKEIIFNKKLTDYLNKNPDIQELDNACVELLGFEYLLGEVNKKYLKGIRLIDNFETKDFEDVKKYYWDNLEALRPYSKAFLNLALAIQSFYKEMNKAGDELFDFAENH